ncbi:dihydroxyacetone kinase phosphoryl donor subunit DhaM [Geomicrobium sp. JCM 19039]|uniref:dihydroxyacetone kinase phosphoryl donor subunit DhaM n=1 Tax=Geomicrobium sp. JCM 19039 TaxID=1460636 RepID=UPI00045F3905|nr:dihydroxyacetone kinase phosphoryl donor subunit DhaM [Geomicrobium sp. JCM 19039]GAK10510.1 phosphoenolpyruvate-dihydroxyacetone phosphotransferase [Geomicrobium sp. JCM 19039]
MSNVTILLLSHVEELARGASRLLSEANAEVEVIAVGGLEDGEIGTSVDCITPMIERIDEQKEILVFYDIGSAKMNAEIVQEMYPDRIIEISDAPLIEAGYVAVITAGLGSNLQEVKEKAEAGYKKGR